MVNSMKIQDKRIVSFVTTQLEEVLTTQIYINHNKKIINLELEIELREIYIECVRRQYIEHRNKEKGSVSNVVPSFVDYKSFPVSTLNPCILSYWQLSKFLIGISDDKKESS